MEEIIRSKERASEHGEVFTPAWLVEAMLDVVKAESQRVDSRVLEPACGSGNFLVAALRRKLAAARDRYRGSEFEVKHHSLLALMCLYGIEILDDNVSECRANLHQVFCSFLGLDAEDVWARAATRVLEVNIVHGDAMMLTMVSPEPKPIIFAEWAYTGRGRYHRRDFRFETLMQLSSFGPGTLFAAGEKHEIFTPIKDFGWLTVDDVAAGGLPRG